MKLDDEPRGFRQLLKAMMTDSIRGGYGWVMSGGTGTGKTVRAKLAAKVAEIPLLRADDMVVDFASRGGGRAVLEDVGHLGLESSKGRYAVNDIIIDDLGQELPEVTLYGTRHDPMREILERRLEKWPDIRTYITTNLTPDQIKRRYGERVASRLVETSIWLTMTCGDRRLNADTGWPTK